MAEGDTILRLARRMNDALAGSPIDACTPGQRRPAGLHASAIDGHALERAESRGKHLLLHFDHDVVLHSHLGMRGSWDIHAQGARWRRPAGQAWIALTGNGAEAVNFGGSSMRIVREAQLLHDPKLARLGPDILAEDFDPGVAVARIRSTGPDLRVGDALLGQRLVAGIGNVFRSEGCFEARIDPRRRLSGVTDDELADLLLETRRLMLETVETGRRPGRVYRRAGRPCPRCGSPISSAMQGDGARTTYWCPKCQAPRPA
jgi:endonuclease VIII